MNRTLRTFVPAAALLLAASACDGGGGPIDVGERLSVEAAGRVERGGTLRLSVRQAGAELPAGSYQVSAEPAGAVEVLEGGTVKLLREGRVEVSVQAPGALGSVTLQVAVPPTVVFDRLVGGNREIWRVALDGGNLQRLTDDPGDDQDPTVGGGKVVFVSYRAGNGELYSVPLAGGATTRLTSTQKNETAPSLSRDGQRLAYTFDETGITKAWVADGEGRNPVRATPVSFGYDFAIEASPSWAPTGTRLALVSTTDGTADVYDVPSTGTPVLIAGGRSTAEVEPAWSADGTMVAFASNRDGAGNTELYAARLSDGQVRRLTNRAGVDALPAWTPDGRIVYVEMEGGVSRLRWLDPADPALASYAIPTGEGSASRPAVAP